MIWDLITDQCFINGIHLHCMMAVFQSQNMGIHLKEIDHDLSTCSADFPSKLLASTSCFLILLWELPSNSASIGASYSTKLPSVLAPRLATVLVV